MTDCSSWKRDFCGSSRLSQFFAWHIREMETTLENWVTLIPARLIPRVIRRRGRNSRQFPVGKVNKCRGGATRASSKPARRVSRWRTARGYLTVLMLRNTLLIGFQTPPTMYTLATSDRTNQTCRYLSREFNLTQDALNTYSRNSHTNFSIHQTSYVT